LANKVNIERVVAASTGRPTFMPNWPETDPDNYVVVSVEPARPAGVRIVVYESPSELDVISAIEMTTPPLFYTCKRDRLGV